MQKVINVLAVSSFLVSAAIVGGAGYLYVNKDSLIEQARERAAKAATEAIAGALPGLIESAMPKMPEITGGAVPGVGSVGGSVGGGIPGF